MSLSLTQNVTAMRQGLKAYFLAIGGTQPYVYSVMPNGAGGQIHPVSGIYTAPQASSSDPRSMIDVIKVMDYAGNQATAEILIGPPLFLLCDIIQKEMDLTSGRVYLYDQKINQPSDSGLYIAITSLSCKVFANSNQHKTSTDDLSSIQSVNLNNLLSIDIISRGPEARDRKEELILALNSDYSIQQQELNSFNIGRIPAGSIFVNLSNIDGAAIPYRYNISVNVQYSYKKIKAVDYYDH